MVLGLVNANISEEVFSLETVNANISEEVFSLKTVNANISNRSVLLGNCATKRKAPLVVQGLSSGAYAGNVFC